jgi:hypothetical protein
MQDFKRLNNLFGWVAFFIAAAVYLGTMEPTTSFWDCGEFIATAYKLEVGHPPGAPFFMLVSRVFSAFGEPENAALAVNTVSALCSAFSILFLFWTISLMALKVAAKRATELGMAEKIAVLGSSFVGAMAYTFSDSFWFSAVEGEVYAMSSLFTSVVFWAILKWDHNADKEHNLKWIVFIAFFIGLSIGVHLLSLLAIPAATFVYYFRKYKVTRKGIIITSLVAMGLLGFVQYGIIPGIISLASKFELLFVNSFGLPFNSGIVFYALLVIGLVVWGLHYTHKKHKVLLNTAILCFTMIVIGYSSFTVIVIRSLANPPMDENNPENVFALLSYLNREQYGDRPLIYGQYFNSPLDPKEPYVDGSPVYFKDKESGKYIIVDKREKSIPNYDLRFTTIFPRMWSGQAKHIGYYKKWSGFKGKPIRTTDQAGKPIVINKPTMLENLTYLFRYQLGWMWGRYFMWNFAGRQNDVQGHGSIVKGNWISGIPAIDEMRLGNQKKLPDSITTNPAHNKFYFLPLILGIIGFFWHFKNSKYDWVVTAMLFVFTGIAILLFLNNYPLEPRERDYGVVGSFYAFAMWIGFGVYAIYDFIKNKVNPRVAAVGSTAICLLAVPALMAAEGWDDHSRAKRYTGRDFAKNYLDSCAPNAILFTNGDNDTFPLWYVQEVEEYRTDVRVVNLSLANTDWYINQMKRKAYDSEAIPSMVPDRKYRQGTNDYLPMYESFPEATVDQVIEWVVSDNSQTKLPVGNGKNVDFIPTKNLRLPVNKKRVVELGIVAPKDTALIVDEVRWSINKNYILKNDLMILDILAANDWERPVYFASTAPSESYLGLEDYFQVDGLAYRLVPIKTERNDGRPGRVDTDILYENVMNKFVWGGLDSSNLYMDENNRRMTISLRLTFSRLAEALIDESKPEKAKEVLDKSIEAIPDHNVPFDIFSLYIAENYYRLGDYESANALSRILADRYENDLQYYMSLAPKDAELVASERNQALAVLQRLYVLAVQQYPQEELGKEYADRFAIYFGTQGQPQGGPNR